MGSYLESVRAGFMMFVGIGVLVLVPLAVWHYLRFGRVEPRRALVLYGLLAYGIVALALIFLPFPDRSQVCQGEQMLSTTPLQWVTDMRLNMAAHGRSGLGAMVTSTAFLQQAFNVVLFIPLGVVLRKAYGRGPFAVVAAGLVISLAVEVVQYSGNFGFYACPYRIADVDDLISNTAGSLLGWMMAPAALVVPRVPSTGDSVAPAGTVTVPRRLLGLVVDLMIVLVTAVLVLPPDPRWALGLVVLLRVVLPAATGGTTIGGWLLRYRIRGRDGASANPLRITARELLGVTGLATYAIVVSPLIDARWKFGFDVAAVVVVVLGTFVVPVFRRDQLGWHERAAGTRDTLVTVERSDAGVPIGR